MTFGYSNAVEKKITYVTPGRFTGGTHCVGDQPSHTQTHTHTHTHTHTYIMCLYNILYIYIHIYIYRYIQGGEQIICRTFKYIRNMV